jgi:hypothetical protein
MLITITLMNIILHPIFPIGILPIIVKLMKNKKITTLEWPPQGDPWP